MNVKKFSATTTRDALRMVRDALGDEAVILSNRKTSAGVEILAMGADEIATFADSEAPPKQAEKRSLSASVLAALTGRKSAPKREGMPALPLAESAPEKTASSQASGQQARVRLAYANQVEDDPVQTDIATRLRQRAMDAVVDNASTHVSDRHTEPTRQSQAAGLAAAIETPTLFASSSASSQSDIHGVMDELRSMRGMLELQLAELSWGSQQSREPFKSTIMRELLAVGLSPALARYLIDKLPANSDAAGGLKWSKSVLGRNLHVMDNENEILEKGGVYALVGPTGVGKTTTTAKLAARCVMRHGPGKLALITTDGYRIGGYEQLRIYGKILGVMVHSVKDEADLRIALEELKGKHTVLIDTVGVSQRDKMVQEQVAMLSAAGKNVKRLLCLPATSTGETLSEVVRAYQGGGLAGAIITKLDEAATLGNVLDVVIRYRLGLYYVANGQRVPEDLMVANQHYLIEQAFKLQRESSAFEFREMELPLVMGNAARTMHNRAGKEAIHG